MTDWLEPKPMEVLSGDERFGDTDLSVQDFWRWSANDLRENVTRGILAEFLVARAVGDEGETRSAWADYDVTSAEGVKIEVKSSAYLQSWRQRKPSQIVFSGLNAYTYSEETNTRGDEREYQADVYVFAVQTCVDPAEYDPLGIAAWEFYVIPVSTLIEIGSPKTISKPRLDKLGVQAVTYEKLNAAVKEAAANPATSAAAGETPRYGENWNEQSFIAALRERYSDSPELAERMIAVYSGLLDAGAELRPGGTEEEPSANLWLSRDTELATSASVYMTGVSINFGWAVNHRSIEEMQRLDDIVRALPGTETYAHLAEKEWQGSGARKTIPPAEILPSDEAATNLVKALVEASLPAEP